MTSIHLVRHGEVHNPASIRYGLLAGFQLSERGRRQADQAARYLEALPRKVAAIVSSPLERATETATIIAERLGVPVTTDDRIIEAPSQFDGMSKTAFLSPQMWNRLRNPLVPSWAEPFKDVTERMRVAIDDLRARHPGRDVVVVSHQSPIWLARKAYEHVGPVFLSRKWCLPASVTTLHFVDDHFDRSHYWAPHVR